MKSITIGFSSPKKDKLGSKLIQWWTGKSYSHVYFHYRDNQGRDLIFHAAHGLVHLVSWERFSQENNTKISYVLDATEEQYQEFRDYYYNKIGLPYDGADLVFVFLRKILLKISLKLNFPNYSGYICSELAAECLNKVFNVELDKPPNMYDPSDIEYLLNSK